MARLTPEEVARMNALLEDQKKQLGDIDEMNSKQAERYQAIQNIQEQANKALEQGLTSTEQKMQDLLDLREDIVEKGKRLVEEQEEITKLLAAQIKLRESGQDYDEDTINNLIAQKEAIEEQLNLEEEILNNLEKRAQLEANLEDTANDYLKTFLGITQQQKGMVGLLQQSMDTGKGLGGALADVAKGLMDGMQAGISLNSVLFSIAGKIQESTVAMVLNTDEALANFNKMTTAGGELNQTIVEASFDTREMGIGMNDTVQAAQDLYENMSGFSELTKDAQGEMLTLAAGMEKAGVSASDTAKIFDTAMKGFGMTTSEATDLSKELLATSQALNVPAGKLAQDFNSAMTELAKYGPEGVDVFKGLAAQAKAAGVEMSTLLGVASQFDTIEGAAGATSRLNAILGSNINTMEMLNATEEDRIALLQQAVNATGKSFDEMDRFEKQAIASAAGISDMSEAAKLFNAETSAFGDAADSMDEVGAAQADMAAATESATSIGEKMTLLFESMAVAIIPLMNLLNFLLEAVLAIVSPIMKVVNIIINFLQPAFEFIAKGIAGFAMVIGITLLPALAGMALGFIKATIAALPIIAIITGIAAVGYVLYEALMFIIDGLMQLGEAILDAFTGNFDGLYDFFVQPFIDAWNAITSFFGFASPAKVAGDLGQGILDGLGSVLSGLTDFMLAPFTMAWDAISSLFSSDMLAGAFDSIMEGVLSGINFATEMVTSILDAISESITQIGQSVINLAESITTFFSVIFAPILDFFSPVIAVMKGIFNMAIAGANAIVGVLNGLSFTVPDWVPFIGGENFGFNLPMLPMLEEGGVIDKEGAAYLHEGEKVVPAAEVSMLDEAMDVMMNPIDAVGGVVGGLVQSVMGTDEVVAAIKENTAAIRALAGGTAGGAGGDVVLELNERELGRAVTKALNDRNQLTLG